jgi:NAD(P)H-dependent FMN reductase
MIVVISGSNRPGANTLKISRLVLDSLEGGGERVTLLDLADLPLELYSPSSYAAKPDAFAPFQDAVLAAEGILTVTPEYNGSYPGALKYFVDMLRFPDSLLEKPCAFVGLSSGRWGAVRAVEQLEMVFQYRCAHLYGPRVFLPLVHELLDDAGRIREPGVEERLKTMVLGFADFCHRVAGTGK